MSRTQRCRSAGCAVQSVQPLPTTLTATSRLAPVSRPRHTSPAARYSLAAARAAGSELVGRAAVVFATSSVHACRCNSGHQMCSTGVASGSGTVGPGGPGGLKPTFWVPRVAEALAPGGLDGPVWAGDPDEHAAASSANRRPITTGGAVRLDAIRLTGAPPRPPDPAFGRYPGCWPEATRHTQVRQLSQPGRQRVPLVGVAMARSTAAKQQFNRRVVGTKRPSQETMASRLVEVVICGGPTACLRTSS